MSPGWYVSGAVLLGGLAYCLTHCYRAYRRHARAARALHGNLRCDLEGCTALAVWETDRDWYTCDEHQPLVIPHYPLPGYAGTSTQEARRRRRHRVPIEALYISSNISKARGRRRL